MYVYGDMLLCRATEMCEWELGNCIQLHLCSLVEDRYSLCPQDNMRRYQQAVDQVTDAMDSMMKVMDDTMMDHKDRVKRLFKKNGTVKKNFKLKRNKQT